MAYRPRGLTFEEFSVGQTLETAARTVLDADIIGFAGLSGDFNPLHVDDEFAKTTPFGRRIAHGMLVLSIGTGLAVGAGYFEGTTIAFLALEAKFGAPTFVGDTLRVRLTIENKRETRKPDRGIVFFALEISNQRDEKVAEGRWTVMMKRAEKKS